MTSGEVVAVPGLGLSADVPGRTLRLLAMPTRVVELPGFGAPARRGDPREPAELADLLLHRIYEPSVLFGHSASSQIVVEAAVRAPERVAAVVLVGPSTDPRAAAWTALMGRWLRTAAWERPGQVPTLLRDYGHTGPGAMARALDAARRHRVDRVVGRVRCPVLVVRGRHDRIAPADWCRALADLAPDGRAVDLRAGAHMVPFTHPVLLADAVATFLSSPGRRVRTAAG